MTAVGKKSHEILKKFLLQKSTEFRQAFLFIKVFLCIEHSYFARYDFFIVNRIFLVVFYPASPYLFFFFYPLFIFQRDLKAFKLSTVVAS